MAGCSTSPRERAPHGQHAHRFQTTLEKTVAMQYLLFLPQDYSRQADRKWPAIVFLHGAGERGNEISLVSVHGPPKIVKERPDFPFVVISPQCAEGETWDVEKLDVLLDEILGAYNVDPDRVYLTGLSMGGYGTWEWASSEPSRFAAAVPICGGGDPLKVRLASGERRRRLSTLPIWAFHGARDSVVALTESERMIAAYREVGNDPRLTIYPEAQHDSWTPTYANPELYEWLLQQSRPQP
jgi:predicted peptidase